MAGSDEEVAAALKAAIQAQLDQLAESTKVLDSDEHQGVTANHVQFACARRYSPTERAGRESNTGYRASTRVVADTTSNARELQRRVDLGLRGVVLSIAGRVTTPIRRESQDDIEPDEQLFSALTTWTFVN